MTLLTTAAVLLSAMATAAEAPVNAPYPLSPDEAARAFLRLVDRLAPQPWKGGQPPGSGPFVLAGALQAKTLTPQGFTVLMIKLPDGESVLVKSPSPLPEIAIDQRVYMVVDFLGEDGAAAARLLGIALACDMKGRRHILDALLGLETPSDHEPVTAPPAQPLQAAARTPSATLPTQSGEAPPSAPAPGTQPAAPSGMPVMPTGARPQGAAAKLPAGWGSPPREADEYEAARERYRVQYWVAYALERNPSLTPAEAEAIVRWVLYYSAYYGVDHRLIFAVIRYESNFNPGCVSRAGAVGLMQLMPATARRLGVDPWVVEENIKGGIAELAGYLDEYSDRSNYEQTILALACYNAGPSAVKRAGGVPQIPETIKYVQDVSELFYRFVKSGAP